MTKESGTNFPLAIVTGASSGIGEQVALLLSRRGYRTILVARRERRLDALARRFRETAPSFPAVIDLADPEAVEPAVNALLAEHGPAQVLVNNAGTGLYLPFLEHQEQDHRRMMQVNYFAAAALIRLVLPGMLAGGRGHVINIASMAGKFGPWGHAGYAAAKAALVSMTQTLAVEYAGRGIHFSYVNPGIVATPFFDSPTYATLPLHVRKRAINPERAAAQIVRLLDRPRLELCIPAHYRMLDMIKAVSPALACKLIAHQSRPDDALAKGKKSLPRQVSLPEQGQG